MAAAAQAARKGGRTQQGNVPAPGQHAPGQFRPPLQKPPASAAAPAAAPPSPGPGRSGTRQSARAKSSAGGRARQPSSNAAPAPAAAASTGTSSPSSPSSAARPVTSSRVSTATREGSGALLVLFAYPVAFNLLRHGPAGAKAWLAAKFINSPSPGFVQSVSSPTGTSPAPAGRPAGRKASPA